MNKSGKKILLLVLAFISCFALITATSFSAVNRKNNQANAVNEVSYYGNKLSSTGLYFYNTLEVMLLSGKFKKCESLTIIDEKVLSLAKTYVGGDSSFLQSFGSNENNTLDVDYVFSAIANEEKEDGIQDLTPNYLTENNEHTHISSTQADCMHKQVCDICKEEFGELGSHKIVTDYYQEPTCTKDGLSPGSHCSVCGKIIIAQKVIAKKGHTVVIDEVISATCEHYGEKIGHCSECGEIITEQIAKISHIDNDYDNKCDVCGNKVTEKPTVELEEDKMPAKDIVMIVLSIIGFVVIFVLVISILKPKKKK